MGVQLTTLAGLIASMFRTAQAAPLPAATLLEAFDSAAGWSVPSASGTLAVDTAGHSQGTGRFVLSTVGTGSNTTKTGYANYSASGMGVIAHLCDHGMDPERAQNGAQLRFGQPTGSPVVNYPSSASLQLYPDYGGTLGDYLLGKIWRFIHTDDLAAAGAGLQDGVPLGLRMLSSGSPPYTNAATVDALYANAAGRPTIILTFDDGRVGPYSEMAYMASRGIRGTIYLPWELVGQYGRLSLAQCQEMAAAGWDFQLDGTGDDQEVTTRSSTVAAAVAHLGEGRAWLAANGLNPDARHFCYPNGTFRVAGTRVQATNVATTAGSPVITMASTTNIAPGMKCESYGVPSGTTVVSVDSATQVTLAADATATKASGGFASFTNTAGEFHTGKLQAGLRAAGWRTGRTTLGGPIHSRWGIGDLGLVLPGTTMTSATLATLQAQIALAKKYGATVVLYTHDIFAGASWINIDQALFRQFVDILAAERDAGNIAVETVSGWWARDCATPALPGT